MKFLHLADLHLGKKLNEYPLREDQDFVLRQAIELAKAEKVDAIVIAGDVYDSSVPNAETMAFYDDFLTNLHHTGIPVLMISGNHDSPERLGVASSILRESGIHIVTTVEDALKPISIAGVNFYLLPHFRPSDVGHAFDIECHGFEGAMKEVIDRMDIDAQAVNVLVTHQAILPVGTKIASSGSETSLDVDAHGDVAGSDIIDLSLFHVFDYLALGHIHKAQNVARNARYPGALLKYHVKEAKAVRSFTIVELNGKELAIHEFPLKMLRDLVVLRGTMDELLSHKGNEGDYVACVLEEDFLVDAPAEKLKAKYPFLIGVDYARRPNLPGEEEELIDDVEEISRPELFERFFERFGGRELSPKEKDFVSSLFKKQEEES